MLLNFADLRTGPDNLYRNFEQSATTITHNVAALKREWHDDQTQIALRHARLSKRASPNDIDFVSRYADLADIFPIPHGAKDEDKTSGGRTEGPTEVQEKETAAEDVDGVIDAFKSNHPLFKVELTGSSIKVLATSQFIGSTRLTPLDTYNKGGDASVIPRGKT